MTPAGKSLLIAWRSTWGRLGSLLTLAMTIKVGLTRMSFTGRSRDHTCSTARGRRLHSPRIEQGTSDGPATPTRNCSGDYTNTAIGTSSKGYNAPSGWIPVVESDDAKGYNKCHVQQWRLNGDYGRIRLEDHFKRRVPPCEIPYAAKCSSR